MAKIIRFRSLESSGPIIANNGTLTASAPVLNLGQTWNNAAVTFTGLAATITNTASNAASLVSRFTVGSTNVFTVNGLGQTVVREVDSTVDYSSVLTVSRGATNVFTVRDDGVAFVGGQSILQCGNTEVRSSGLMNSFVSNLFWAGANSYILELYGSTNPHTFRIYNTFTSTTNHERGFLRWSSNVFQIGTEKGSGGGAARALELSTDGNRRLLISSGGETFLGSNTTVNGSVGVYVNPSSNQVQLNSNSHMVETRSDCVRILAHNAAQTGTIAHLTISRGLVQFGAGGEFAGASFLSTRPALKRDSTTLRLRLGDDSADAPFSCSALTLSDDLTFGSGDNIVLSSTTGTKIGTATDQKIGFFNATPVVQPVLTADLLDSLQGLGLVASGSGDTPLNLSGGTLTAGNLVLTDNDGPQTATFDAQSKLTANRTYNLPDASGTLALTSQISKTLDVFTATDNQPPPSGFATFDTRSSVLVLDYDDTVTESGTFIGMIPETAGTITGLQVRILWTATSATGNNCRWGARFADLSSSGINAPFDLGTEVNSAANSVSGITSTADIFCSGTAGLMANEFYRLLIYRNSADTVNDTMAGDAELVSVTTYLT